MNGAAVNWINDGARLHLQHGPIDLVIEADGAEKVQAYRAAVKRFEPLLQELVDELALLKMPVKQINAPPEGVVAKRMLNAARKTGSGFITSMIAVAGSVADEVCEAMFSTAAVDRVCVNNGGDIAIYLAPGNRYRVGVITDPRTPALSAGVTIDAADPVRGIATSGRHGRSLSTGIADAVTTLAANAAQADAAATIIANAVDLPDCSSIKKVPARDIDPDSDLCDIEVTVEVEQLSAVQIATALQNGAVCAQELVARGVIYSSYLHLAGHSRVVGRNQLVHISQTGESVCA